MTASSSSNGIHAPRRFVAIMMLLAMLQSLLSATTAFLLRPISSSLYPTRVLATRQLTTRLQTSNRRGNKNVGRQHASATLLFASADTSSSSSFDWKTEWYPVVPVLDLKRNAPNKITLLGMDFVVWHHDASDSWRVFADKCPHRLVPLSEGRVESNGMLQCAYHGWEFDENGVCERIPQLESPTAASTMPRACATSFPLQVKQGLVWIFPTADFVLAESKSLPLIPELDDPACVDATQKFCRDLPYSWEVLVENLCDPSHVNFAHHSFMGGADRNQESLQLNMQVTEQHSHGFNAKKNPYPSGSGKYDVKFQAPCLLFYTLVNESGSSFLGLGQYCIPVAPNRSRLIARFPFSLPIKPAMYMIRHTPRWITHYSQNIVMDSDVVFLTSQDEALGNTKSAEPPYFMPSQCDAMVVAFRKWISREGTPEWIDIPAQHSFGESISWNQPPARFGRDALLDRYRQHTEICTSCRRAHKILRRLKEYMAWTGILLLAGASIVGKRISALCGAALLLAPRILIQPLIARLECVPWPRKKWLRPTPRKVLVASRAAAVDS